MKLHLPKTLLSAVLALSAATEAVAYDTGYSYTVVADAVKGTQTPTTDTAYKVKKDANTDTFSVSLPQGDNAEAVNIKLIGDSATGEYNLGTVNANSVWMSSARYVADTNDDLKNAGKIYLCGGLLQLTGASMSLGNDIVLGTSSYNENGYPQLSNVSLRVGYWGNDSTAKVTLTKTVTVAENTRIVLQRGNNGGSTELNLTGTLTGSGNIQLDRHSTVPATFTIAAVTSTYTGVIDLDGSNTTEGSMTLALGKDSVHLGGLSSDGSTNTHVTLASGTTASTLTLDVAADANLTYKGSIAANISIVKDGEGSQTLSGSQTLGDVTVSNGKLIIDRALTLNGTVTGSLTINSLNNFTKVYTGGLTAGNGIIDSVQVLTDSSSKKEGVEISYGDETYTTNDGGFIDYEDSVFYVKTGSEAASTAKTLRNTVELANGTGLTVDADIATVKTAADATSATLTVAASGGDSAHTLTTLSAEDANVLVNGAGTLTITNATASTLTAGNAPVEGATTTAPALTLDLGGSKKSVQNLVINDGATVTTTYGDNGGNVSGFIQDSITINAGGTLKHTGNNLSPFGAGESSLDELTLNGSKGKTATLKLTNRTVIQGTAVTMNGYSTIGSTAVEGAVTDAKETENPARDNKAILDFIGTNKVTATGTNNNIDAALRLRGNSNTTFKVENAGDELSLNGKIFKANNASSTTFTKEGDGKLIINSSSVELDTMNVTNGTLQLKDTASLGNAAITMGTGTDLEAGTGTIKTLTFAAGAELTADTAVSMGGALTFQGAITLDGALLKNIQALEEGGTLDLFTGVTSLVVNGTTYSTLTEDSNVDLGVIFTLNGVAVAAETAIAGSGYYLGYSDSTVYAGKVVPEPTTATLSLLALAGLAARRRRK